MSTYFHLPDNIPTDGQTVWIRVEYYYSEPFLAIFTLSTMTFMSVDNSIVYPAWVVARWKP
jgi:methenyltetrahydromethanopterin cyclohydrolase